MRLQMRLRTHPALPTPHDALETEEPGTARQPLIEHGRRSQGNGSAATGTPVPERAVSLP
jgi:hypothetical protein